jgi:hypothetical protein
MIVATAAPGRHHDEEWRRRTPEIVSQHSRTPGLDARRGVSRSVATKLTGHKTEAIYRRYAIVRIPTSATLRCASTGTAQAQRRAQNRHNPGTIALQRLTDAG